MCGEQQLQTAGRGYGEGSPPRVRGTGKHFAEGWHGRGITPACAGNRTGCNRLYRPMGDHPRVCGEQIIRIRQECLRMGSPPRVRGTGPIVAHGEPGPGITPACAGNSRPYTASWSRRQDHPRVCGEQDVSLRSNSPHQGSPPRVRGTDHPHVVDHHHGGITPACAGNRPPARTGPRSA